MTIDQITEIIHEYMYEQLNESTDTEEDEKNQTYINKSEKKTRESNIQRETKKKTNRL